MNCKELRNHLFDIVDGVAVSPAMDEHLKNCTSCAGELKSLRATMSLMDEWQAPADTSPYFMTRLRARLDDEPARAWHGWLQWFRKPALAVSLAGLMVASISLYRNGSVDTPPATNLKPGSAVADLQYLDKNHDVLTDFDLLDDLDSGPVSQ